MLHDRHSWPVQDRDIGISWPSPPRAPVPSNSSASTAPPLRSGASWLGRLSVDYLSCRITQAQVWMPTFPIYLLLTASESGCGILYSPWNFLGQNTGVGSLSVLQGIFPAQGSIESRSLTLQGDSLPAEPPGKPKNTGVGSLSLLQQIFLTQELNQGLLHCSLGSTSSRSRGGSWVCAQSCPTMDCSSPGSSVHGILQARIPEWAVMPSSRGSSWSRNWTCVSWGTCFGSGFCTT